MGWRTDLQSYGAQYITSIAKNTDAIKQLVPELSATKLGMRDVIEWIIEHAGPTFDAITCLRTI